MADRLTNIHFERKNNEFFKYQKQVAAADKISREAEQAAQNQRAEAARREQAVKGINK